LLKGNYILKKALLLPLLVTIGSASTQINSINFENLSRISSKVALENVGLSKGDTYNTPQITQAIKKFYKFGYFDDISVVNTEGNITFKFIEKPSIVKIEISGYKARDDDKTMIYEAMGIKKGSMYTDQRVANAKAVLLDMLQQEGYYNSVVELDIENISDKSVAIKFEVNKGSQITITKINYHGAKHFTTNDFEDIVANKAQESFSWFLGRNNGEMKLDQLKYEHARIKEMYLTNGYLDATVSKAFSKIDFNTNKSEIDFSISEGNQYKVGDILIFLDSSIKDPSKIISKLKLKKDKIFNIKNLRKDVEFIKEQVANEGYAFTQVTYDIRKDKDNNIASVNFNVIPGKKVYINDVIISGNHRTLDSVIRRDIYLSPEDLYSLTDFKESKNALQRSGFFEMVNIQQQRVSEDKMNLIVTVQEARTGNIMLGGGYGSYDGFMINAGINDKNIFGSGINLGFSIDTSARQQNFNISVQNPAIHDSKYSGSFNVYNRESSYEETYTDNSSGFSLGIGKQFNRHTTGFVNYSYSMIDRDYSSDTDNNGNPQPDDGTWTTSSITPSISFNNTDDYYLPRSGISARTSLELAGIGGDTSYVKSNTSFKTYYGLEDYLDFDMILRYRANLSIYENLNNDGIVRDTGFYLGGPRSVRGYESYAYGYQINGIKNPQDRMFTNSIEASMPLIESAKMRLAFFFDTGIIGEQTFDTTMMGYGAQIEWTSPMGPLTFIFGKAISPDEGVRTSSFEFSMGNQF
jgi:outer membrane protein insertion porin family